MDNKGHRFMLTLFYSENANNCIGSGQKLVFENLAESVSVE